MIFKIFQAKERGKLGFVRFLTAGFRGGCKKSSFGAAALAGKPEFTNCLNEFANSGKSSNLPLARHHLAALLFFFFGIVFTHILPLWAESGTQPCFSLKKVENNPHHIVINYVEKEGFVALDDGSCWKMLFLKEKPKQSWWQWVNNEFPKEWNLQDCFFFDPVTWLSRDPIQIYESSVEFFFGYRHILENIRTGQKAFAEFIPFGTKQIPKFNYVKTIMERSSKSESKILINRYFLKNALILDNGECWQIFPAEEKKQTWSNWLYGKSIDPAEQPDASFVFAASSWLPSDQIRIYFYSEEDPLISIYASATKIKGVYLIENKTRDQLTYAHPLTIADIDQLWKELSECRYNSGYNTGCSVGHQAGHKAGHKIGHDEGYKDGYIKGYDKGRQEEREEQDLKKKRNTHSEPALHPNKFKNRF